MSSDPFVRKDIVNLTCQFLETWFHQILYQRNLYPRSIFELQKKFQVPVYIASHPGVQTYISNFVQSCYPLIEKSQIKFINLTILHKDKAIEKFVFEIKSSTIEIDLTDLEQHLRACLIKINQIQPFSKNIDNPSYSLSMEKIEGGYPESVKQDWIPHQTNSNWNDILPLKSVPLFNTFIMESSSRKGKERSK